MTIRIDNVKGRARPRGLDFKRVVARPHKAVRNPHIRAVGDHDAVRERAISKARDIGNASARTTVEIKRPAAGTDRSDPFKFEPLHARKVKRPLAVDVLIDSREIEYALSEHFDVFRIVRFQGGRFGRIRHGKIGVIAIKNTVRRERNRVQRVTAFLKPIHLFSFRKRRLRGGISARFEMLHFISLGRSKIESAPDDERKSSVLLVVEREGVTSRILYPRRNRLSRHFRFHAATFGQNHHLLTRLGERESNIQSHPFFRDVHVREGMGACGTAGSVYVHLFAVDLTGEIRG